MIYTHVARKGVAGVTSPLDLLDDLTVQQIGDAVAATGFSASSTSVSERLH